MSSTLKGVFATRRDAEMVVERLVQELGIERTDIFVAPDGDENSAGNEAAGSDIDDDADPQLEGGITVSVDLEDDDLVDDVREAFEEFGAE
ncbi:MAG: hypothetical protein ABW184_04210 [Sphingobium sp.]